MALLIGALAAGTAYKMAQVDPLLKNMVNRERHIQVTYADWTNRNSIENGQDVNWSVVGAELGTHGLPKYFIEGPGGTRYMMRRLPPFLTPQCGNGRNLRDFDKASLTTV